MNKSTKQRRSIYGLLNDFRNVRLPKRLTYPGQMPSEFERLRLTSLGDYLGGEASFYIGSADQTMGSPRLPKDLTYPKRPIGLGSFRYIEASKGTGTLYWVWQDARSHLMIRPVAVR